VITCLTTRASICALFCSFVAVAATAVEPFTKPPQRSELANEEDRLWDDSKETSIAIRRRGALLNEAAYTKHLNELMTRLYPEFGGMITVRIVRETLPNAFVFPNGDSYISLGLLARLENEAQIAMVLGHEGAHFVQRHSYRGRQTRLVAGTLINIVGIAGGAVGSVGALGGALGGQILLLGGAQGHNRDMEREADQIGFARAQKLGVGKRDAVRAFEVLRDYVKHADQPDGVYLFASHPRLEERIESLSSASGVEPSSMPANPQFAEMHRALRLTWLPLELTSGRHKAMVAALEDAAIRANMPIEATLYLSEAYRLRGHSGDVELADKTLDEAAQRAPAYPPVARALGQRAMRWGHRDEAIKQFNEYLRLAPISPDRGFIESYLKQLETEGKKE
jgi:beta-barrel assembly-enhancing protease